MDTFAPHRRARTVRGTVGGDRGAAVRAKDRTNPPQVLVDRYPRPPCPPVAERERPAENVGTRGRIARR